MKFVVIFTIYIICFISSSTGLKCYECDDAYQHYAHCSSDPVVKVCDERPTFCVTATSKIELGQYSNCGENKCVVKGCIDSKYCP